MYSGLSNERVPRLTAVFKVLARESNARIRIYFTEIGRDFPGTKACTKRGAAARNTMERRNPKKVWTDMRVYVRESLCISSSDVSRVVSPLPMVDLRKKISD